MATKIISIANQKGGVGKTTTTINLAAAVANFGKRTLIIDLDPQGNATSGVGLEKAEGGSIYLALLGEEDPAEKIVPTDWDNLQVIPSELDLAGAEIDVARSDHYLTALRNAVEGIKASSRFDYVFIDCPPSIGILTMNALTASHSILIPFQCEYFALEGISSINKVIRDIRNSGTNPSLHIEGIVLTMFDKRTNLAHQVEEEVRGYFKDFVYDTKIPRSIRLSEAPSHGLPVIHYDYMSAGAVAYRSLAQEFILRVGDHEELSAEPTGAPPAGETSEGETSEPSGQTEHLAEDVAG